MRRRQRNQQPGFLESLYHHVGQFSMTDNINLMDIIQNSVNQKPYLFSPESWLICSLSHPPPPPRYHHSLTLLITLSPFLSLISSLSLPLRSFSSSFFFLISSLLRSESHQLTPKSPHLPADEDLCPSCFLTPVCSISWVITLTTPNPALCQRMQYGFIVSITPKSNALSESPVVPLFCPCPPPSQFHFRHSLLFHLQGSLVR